MRNFEPNDIYAMQWHADPRISPDGSKIAFVEAGLDEEENEYTTRIWVTSTDFAPMEMTQNDSWTVRPSKAKPFTSGKHRDSKPRWSPDGASLAFVSHRNEKGSQLMVMPIDGGEPEEMVDWPEEIEELLFSPDGSSIAFTARDRNEDLYGQDKEKDQPPRRITRAVYRLDSVGWTVDRPRHLFVLSLQESKHEPRQLTFGESQVGGFTWSPDSTEIVFASSRHDDWDLDLSGDLFVISSEGGEPQQLTETGSSFNSPSFSPDGKRVAFIWTPKPIDGPWHGRLGLLDRATSKVKILTEKLDLNTNVYPPGREPQWDQGLLWFSVEDAGSLKTMSIDPSGDAEPEVSAWIDESQTVSFDVKDGLMAAVGATALSMPGLRVTSPRLRAEAEELMTERLKTIGDKGEVPKKVPWMMGHRGVQTSEAQPYKDIDISTPVRFTATSKDGTEVEAWVMRPGSLVATKKYPALLNIHGGPFTQYGHRFFDEFQAYAGAGYAVIYCNPRGSSGYSEAWGRAIRGPKTNEPGSGWGGVDFEDIMAVTEEAVARFPYIDGDKLGVMGGSYGGYMTSWIIGHDNRFKAAISERAVNNMLTMCYTSDVASYFSREMGPSYLDDPEEYLRISPITYVKNIDTPVLIMHSENDLRCPIEQAEQLFMALKMLGKPVEFVRFPGESHELSRSGAPKHRVQRLELIIEWFDRYLK